MTITRNNAKKSREKKTRQNEQEKKDNMAVPTRKMTRSERRLNKAIPGSPEGHDPRK